MTNINIKILCYASIAAIIIFLQNYSILAVEFILLLLLFGCMIICLENRTKTNKEDKKYTLCEVALFSFLPIYKFLYLYLNNINSIPWLLTLGIVFGGIAMFILVFHLFKLLLKNNSDAICLALLTLTIFVFNSKINSFYDVQIFNSHVDTLTYCSLLIFSILITIIANTKLFLVFVKHFSIALLSICLLFGTFKFIDYVPCLINNQHQNITTTHNTQFNKNIYIILLDAYSGTDVLKKEGFNNQKFIKQLRKKNFLVFENIDSNYDRTLASLPSILNFDYLNNLNMLTANEAINNAKLFKIVKKLGYHTYYYNSWPCDIKIEQANFYKTYSLNKKDFQYFYDIFFNNSLFAKMQNYLPQNKEQKEIDYKAFLNDALTDQSPKLVFLHLLMPHAPYLYDKNGNPLNVNDDFLIKSTLIYNKQSYIEYLQYTNKETNNLVNEILAHDKNPIIIVTGDHGIRKILYTDSNKKRYNELMQDKLNFKSHYNTMLAYYNTDTNKYLYTEIKTLVNFFRLFANENFQTNYPFLEDKKYYVYLQTPLNLKEGKILTKEEDFK